ncbi:MAG: class I SAM-dependent methyltransferase [Pyrinomonadaceae bacterium]
MKITEAIKLLSRLPKNPVGVYDELKVRRELRREHSKISPPSYQPEDFEKVVSEIERCLQQDLRGFLTESALAEIEETVRQNIEKISKTEIPFPLTHNGDPKLGKLCYIICRAIKPRVFVETGVAFGVTSSFILKALEVNNYGKLFSVDRPPAVRNAAEFIGALIPDELRRNWNLYRGESQKLLPALLAELKGVNIFLHDSRHTYSNMSAEFRLVAPFLANRSFLLADDANRNIAFEEWTNRTNPAYRATIAEDSKESLFGVSFFREKPSYRQ